MKKRISIINSGLFAIIIGLLFSTILTISPLVGVGGALGAAFFKQKPSNTLGMGVLVESWTGEIIKKFDHTALWLNRIPSKNEYVNKNVIHLTDIGADPAVLINNTTYPIASAGRTDTDVPVGLDKFDTENTIITKDELYALPYDKKGSVIDRHKTTLEYKTADKAAHSLAPSVNSATTPIVMSTGASTGGTYPRKRITPDDLIEAKFQLDELGVPTEDRILVLCNAHVNDLLKADEKFKEQYKNIKTGEILPMYGFDIYQYLRNPIYKVVTGTLTKKAFGAVADLTNDQNASFFFYAGRAFQARGTVDMFYADASTDPKYRRNEVGFQLYHICMPQKVEGFGALVSSLSS